MGRGIISHHRVDPLREWSSRLRFFGSDELAADLRALLGGAVVRSEDGVLEISIRRKASGRYLLTMRRPSAPYAADVELAPIPGVGGRGLDRRNAVPCPERWTSTIESEVIEWELFNCVVYSLIPREQ